jgi:hypothetical protein
VTDDEFVERFLKLHKEILERFHRKIDSAMRDLDSRACQDDPRYHAGWNAGLNWAHRIVRGDKSAD